MLARRSVLVLCCLVTLYGYSGASADSVYTQLDLRSINNNTPFYDPTDTTCADTGNEGGNPAGDGNIVPAGQNSGTWNSGLKPPYSFEQFMIELLKDIAKKRGVPASSAVTQQHVIGLLALAWGEGGGRTNNDFWNPFNAGIDATDLTVGGVHVGNGVQAFKSFDDGVEATARSMTGVTQGRLGVTLTNPNTIAVDFLSSWLDFPPSGPYAVGHHPWAEASDPSSPSYESNYEQVRLGLIAQVAKNYDSMASTIMRGKDADPADKHVPYSTMTYRTATATAASAPQSQSQGCACTIPGTSAITGSNVIVIDPGHNKDDSYIKNGNKDVIDQATGLKDYDYANTPEIDEVYDVATKVQDKLTKDGYKVIMTKQPGPAGHPGMTDANPTNSPGSFRVRADLANNANAALAISIHDQSGASDGLPFNSQNNFVYIQQMGMHRDRADGTQVKFGTAPAAGNKDEADTSARYGKIFADTRTAIEGHKVTVTTASINRGPRFSPGNIWMVQLFSNVPWIYNEVGGNSAGRVGLSEADKTKYANGLIASVEKAVPLSPGNSAATSSPASSIPASGCTSGGGAFFDTAKAYTWPTYHSAPYCVMKPEYETAVRAALARIKSGKNDYVGGGSLSITGGDCSVGGHAGIDCGGFVTRVFRDSGADANYNSSHDIVVAQYQYVVNHPQLYQLVHAKTPSDLHPGDIYFEANLQHTYIFVGAYGWPGYDAVSASFSTTGRSWRTPMASRATGIASAIWYRPLYSLTASNTTTPATVSKSTPSAL